MGWAVDFLELVQWHMRHDLERLVALMQNDYLLLTRFSVILGLILVVAGAASETRLVFPLPDDNALEISAKAVGSIGLGLFAIGGGVELVSRVTKSRRG